MASAVHFDHADASVPVFDRINELGLVALLLVTTLSLGGATMWAEAIFEIGAAALALVLATKLIARPTARFVWSWTYVPMVLFVALVGLQLIELPSALVAHLSPGTDAFRVSLTSQFPVAAHGTSASPHGSIAFYREAATEHFRMLLGVCAVYIVALNTLRTAAAIERTLFAIAMIGGAVAVCGLGHILSGTQYVYGIFKNPYGAWTTAPFINKNHFGQFMNLSLGATSGIFLLRVYRLRAGWRSEWPAMTGEHLGARVDSRIWLLAGALLVQVLALVFSLSRGAMISALLAAAATLGFSRMRRFTKSSVGGSPSRLPDAEQRRDARAADDEMDSAEPLGSPPCERPCHDQHGHVHRKRRKRAGDGARGNTWVFLALLWLAATIVVAFGSDLLIARFAPIAEADNEHSLGGRVRIASDVLRASRAFPVFGVGLGNFEYVYPSFDTSRSPALAAHADDDWAQLLFECGWAGVVIAVAFLILVFRRLAAAASLPSRGLSTIGLAMGFALIAVVIHSVGDFGQRLPANAMLTALYCAMLGVIGVTNSRIKRGALAASAKAIESDRPEKSADAGSTATNEPRHQPHEDGRITGSNGQEGNRSMRTIGRWAVLGCVAFAGLQIAATATDCARAESDSYEAQRLEARARRDNWNGEDDDFRRLLAAAQDASERRPGNVRYNYALNLYRWRLIARESDPATGLITMDARRIGQGRRVVRELFDGLGDCPTFGPGWSLAGQIQRSLSAAIPDRAEAAAARAEADGFISTGYRLTQNDPVAAFEAALLDARAGKWDAALAEFAKAAALNPPFRAEAAVALARDFGRVDLSMDVAADDVEAVRSTADALDLAGNGSKNADSRELEADNSEAGTASESPRKLITAGRGDRAPGSAAALEFVRDRLRRLIEERAALPSASVKELVSAADQASDARDYDTAIKLLRRALHGDATRADLHERLAAALGRSGETREAIDEARVSMSLGSKSAQELLLRLRTEDFTDPLRKTVRGQ